MSQDPAGPDGMLAQAIASTRAEQDGDAAFLFALFCRSRAPGEDLAFFDPALREQLMRSQFIGQSASYRAAFPDARYEIVEQGARRLAELSGSGAARPCALSTSRSCPIGAAAGSGRG